MDAGSRLTAGKAMQHPYFEGLWEDGDLVTYSGKEVKLFFENLEVTRELLELGFLNEIHRFHPEIEGEVRRRAGLLKINIEDVFY